MAESFELPFGLWTRVGPMNIGAIWRIWLNRPGHMSRAKKQSYLTTVCHVGLLNTFGRKQKHMFL